MRCLWVRSGGVSDGSLYRGWRCTKLPVASALLRVVGAWGASAGRVCAMHPFYIMDSLRVSAYYCTYPFRHLLFCYSFLFSLLFVVLPCFVLFFSMPSLELFRCSNDIFQSSRPRSTRLTTNRVYYWVWLRPDRLT